MAVEDEFVKVGGLLGGEPVQSEVVENEQIRGQEGPEGAVSRAERKCTTGVSKASINVRLSVLHKCHSVMPGWYQMLTQ